MNTETVLALLLLRKDINTRLDKIHDEALRKFRALAKSIGQRTRVDRVMK